MRTYLQKIMLLAVLLFPASAFAAEEHGTAEEAVALVHKAIAHMKANGIEKTIAIINKEKNPSEVAAHKGEFVDRDLYVTIWDMKGKNLAHLNTKLVGKNLIDRPDSDGKLYMKERIEIVKAKGKGWQNYKYPNPVTGKVEEKSMYFERYEDVIVNCGIYRR